MTQVRVPHLRRSDHPWDFEPQPFRAGLTFSGRPSGPRIRGDFAVSSLAQLAVGKLAVPNDKGDGGAYLSSAPRDGGNSRLSWRSECTAAVRPATLSATSQFLMEAQPHPLSSRAKPRDLQCALPPNNCLRLFQPLATVAWERHPPLCHPERSRGICSSTQPLTEARAKKPARSSMAIISSRLAPSLCRASSKSSARTGYQL
jgi:hypothetical protein